LAARWHVVADSQAADGSRYNMGAQDGDGEAELNLPGWNGGGFVGASQR
jgi:hypothetical protein